MGAQSVPRSGLTTLRNHFSTVGPAAVLPRCKCQHLKETKIFPNVFQLYCMVNARTSEEVEEVGGEGRGGQIIHMMAKRQTLLA